MKNVLEWLETTVEKYPDKPAFSDTILGVDKSLYEAAAADGAGRFKRIWHVTLPGMFREPFALMTVQHPVDC